MHIIDLLQMLSPYFPSKWMPLLELDMSNTLISSTRPVAGSYWMEFPDTGLGMEGLWALSSRTCLLCNIHAENVDVHWELTQKRMAKYKVLVKHSKLKELFLLKREIEGQQRGEYDMTVLFWWNESCNNVHYAEFNMWAIIWQVILLPLMISLGFYSKRTKHDSHDMTWRYGDLPQCENNTC